MKTKPASEYAVLGALMTGLQYGYEIRSFLREHLGSTWYISTSQLYSLLKRLEQAGKVASEPEFQETRPAKRVFTLTEAGKRAFLEWISSPTEHVRDLRIEFLAKLFYVRWLHLDGRETVRDQERILEQAVDRIRKGLQRERDPYRRLTGGFKLTTAEAWLDWVRKEARRFVEEAEI